MGFSGENKLFSEWQETTAPADDDYFLTGKSAIKKIKWSTIINLIKAKLGIADINKSISDLNSSFAYSNSYKPNGLTAVVRIRNNGFGIRITGTVVQNLGTGTNYATVANIPELSKVLNRDIITREVLATGIIGQLRINQTGAIQIGYTTGNDGNAVSILSGTVFWLEKSFFVN